jgi:hypothetical protein
MPNFDKSDGFSLGGSPFAMNIGGNSKVNDGSFNEKQTGLLKAAPLYKSLVGDQDKLPTVVKDAIRDSPVRKNGKDKDDFNYKSDMGKYNPTITSYEGDAFVGTTGGGKRQPKGKKVSGLTQTGNSSNDEFFRGTVTGSGSSQSEQDSKVKGATYRS